MKSEQELIISIITNTQRSFAGRNLSIYDIALDIKLLKDLKGSLSAVAEIAKISTNMLNKFLAAFKLSESTLELVKSRKIDSVEIVYSIAKYPVEIQDEISKYIINGSLKSQDVRALSSYIKVNQGEPIGNVIEKFISTKNVKVSVIKFPITDKFLREEFYNSISKIVGAENIVSIEYDQQIGTIKMLKKGESIIRSKAKENNFNLNQYINWLIKLHTI